MSTQAQKRAGDILKAEEKLAAKNAELKLDLAQAAIDLVGIADPTPVSDVIGAGLSLYRGDFIGAGLSLISVVPYVGDAIGKTAKGAKLVKKIEKLRSSITESVKAINLLRKEGADMASAATRAKAKARAAGNQPSDALCQTCLNKLDAGDNPFGTRSPTTGWGSATKGDGPWTPDASTSYGRDLIEWQKKNGVAPGTPINFKDGFPDFSPYAKESVTIRMVGNDADFAAAAAAMRKKDPNWIKPEKTTWHHHEDGVTMLLVPKAINSVPHTGGAALSKVPGY